MTKCMLAAALVSILAMGGQDATPPAARPNDVKSMDAVIAAAYDTISGPAGQKRDWDRFRSLFAPGARLIPTVAANGGATARVFSVDDYIQRSTSALDRGFFEHEIARRTDTFGNIAQVFRTYESRHAASDATPFARGINSFQLLKDGDRWWIVTNLLGQRASRKSHSRTVPSDGARALRLSSQEQR